MAWEPPRHLGYVAHRGLPVRHYRADIVLSPDGSGTHVTWTGSLEPLVPGTGRLTLAYARSFVQRFADELVRATRRPVAGSAGSAG